MNLIDLIQQLGFPIACVIGLAWFCYKMFQDLQTSNKEREEKLYDEITECRLVNNKAIETIASYAEKLDSIQKDVAEIKIDVTAIKAKE